MTTHRLLVAAGCILAGSLLTTAPAMAQQAGAPPAPSDRRGPPPMDARRGPPTVDDRVKRMTEELGLNAEQATKVKAVLTAERRQADSVLAQRARQQDAERDAMNNIRSSTEKSLASILTPEQRTKHDAMRARGGPMGHGFGGPRGRGGPEMRDRRGPGRGGDDRRPGRDDTGR